MPSPFARAAALLSLTLAACAASPLLTMKGDRSDTYALTGVAVTDTGVELQLKADCARRYVEQWCPTTDPKCVENPVRVRREPEACEPDTQVAAQVRTPWGAVYEGSGPAAKIAIPVEWARAGVDPLAPGAAATLRDGWFVRTAKGGVNDLYKPTDADLEAMLLAIGNATDTQYELKTDVANTRLTVAFQDAKTPNTVALAVTNTGTTPAYRVVGTLRSSYGAAHGLRFSFGRIDPNQTKTRTRQVVAPSQAGDLSPTVVAEVTGANISPVLANRRLELVRGTAAALIQLRCAQPDEDVGPGQRARLRCELSNEGDTIVTNPSYTALAGTATTTTNGPRELKPHDKLKAEFLIPIPADAKPGAKIPLAVTISLPGAAPVTSRVEVTITDFAGGCKTKLTRDAYQAKRKRLQSALDSGALTREEFDKYDAALVACLQ